MRTPSDPVARLAKLEAARAGVEPGEVFNADQTATIVGMSWRALKAWIADDPNFPVVTRGSEGVPWQLDAAAVLDHMIVSARTVQADRERRTERATFLAGLGGDAGEFSPAGGGAGSGSAAREMLDDARALEKLIDVQAKLRGEKQKQGELIDRGSAEAFLWRWLSGLQSDVLAIEGRIDKVGALEPPVRQAIKDELAAALVAMRAGLEQQIEAWRAPRR